MASTRLRSTAAPTEFRQRRPRPTANPVALPKPDIVLEFSTSKLGIRVRSSDSKVGLFVAAVTDEAPASTKEKVPVGAQIISVNEHNLENSPFDTAVEHFAQLSLPISVRFRPPLHPPRARRRHDDECEHHHNHHDDDEDDGTCYIACYLILFVISFMFAVSVALNGFTFPTSMPSMPRLFPAKKDRRGRRRRNYEKSAPEEIMKQYQMPK